MWRSGGSMICFDLFCSSTQQINFPEYYSWEKIVHIISLKGLGTKRSKALWSLIPSAGFSLLLTPYLKLKSGPFHLSSHLLRGLNLPLWVAGCVAKRNVIIKCQPGNKDVSFTLPAFSTESNETPITADSGWEVGYTLNRLPVNHWACLKPTHGKINVRNPMFSCVI